MKYCCILKKEEEDDARSFFCRDCRLSEHIIIGENEEGDKQYVVKIDENFVV